MEFSATGDSEVSYSTRTLYKTSNLIVAFLIYGTLMLLASSERGVRTQSEKSEGERQDSNWQIANGDPSQADSAFLKSIDSLRKDADRQFLQARLMLVAGIFVAIAGVAIFATILDVATDDGPRSKELSLFDQRLRERALYEARKPSEMRRVLELIGSRSADSASFLTLEEIVSVSKADVREGQLEKALNYNAKLRELGLKQDESNTWLASNYPSLAKSFRSFALFLALEAIAWFLLRQYRFAIADFKQLFRMYVKRQGYYLAFKVSQAGGTGAEAAVVAVAASLLQEDLSGRLVKDQTTEDLQERTFVESNPVTDLWGKLVDRLTPAKKSGDDKKD